jgi:catechol 2,3-dioxygenase-like lactoylglutathione lyase family enzyme
MLGDHLVFPIVLSMDLAVSRAFYRDTLGLAIAREDPDRIMFRCGGGSLLAVSLSTTGTRDTQTQLAWRVVDLKSELADLRTRGVHDPGVRRTRPEDRGRDRRHGLRVGRVDRGSAPERPRDHPTEGAGRAALS